jgi:hypothetical protein
MDLKPLKKEIKALNRQVQELYKRIKKTKDKELQAKLSDELEKATSEFQAKARKLLDLVKTTL